MDAASPSRMSYKSRQAGRRPVKSQQVRLDAVQLTGAPAHEIVLADTPRFGVLLARKHLPGTEGRCKSDTLLQKMNPNAQSGVASCKPPQTRPAWKGPCA